MPTAITPQSQDAKSIESAAAPAAPVRLTRLRAGDHGQLHAARLVAEDWEMLRALGLAEQSHFRVCKAGDPWILQVRTTRVGISDAVADSIMVIRERQQP